MAVKVLIKRRFKEKYFNEINEMLKKLRYGAMGHEGYMSSETLWDSKDPYRVVVASNWRTEKEWNIWKNSELRRIDGENMEKYLDGETEYEIYEMGLYPH
jgi:heme-degrading monooxygenase HmoA